MNLKKLFILFFLLSSIVFFSTIVKAEDLPKAKTFTEQTGIDASASSYELISSIGNLSQICDVGDLVYKDGVLVKDKDGKPLCCLSGESEKNTNTGENQCKMPTDKVESKGFSNFINLLIRIAIALAGAIAVVMLIIGGIQYMGTDSVWEKGESRTRMTSAITGLVLLLTSYFILYNINPDLVDIKIGGMKVSEGEWEKVEFDKGTRPWIGSTPADISKASPSNIIQSNITTYDAFLKKAATATGLSCTDLKAFAFVETGFDKDVVNGTKTSSSGAAGMMALMPATGKIYGCNTPADLSDPEKSALCGAKFLKELKTKACNGSEKNDVCNTTDTKYISAAYNGGPGVNVQSKDCPNEKIARWQCHTNQGGLKETEYYTVKIAANQKQLKDKGWGCD